MAKLNFHGNKLNSLFASYSLTEPLKIIKKPKVRQYLQTFMQANRQNLKPRQISEQYSKEFDQIKKTQQRQPEFWQNN